MRHDGVVTTPTVWISTATPEIRHDSENPGSHWQLVGEIDTTEESEFWNAIRRGSSEISEFYLSGDPGNAWVQAVKQDPRSRESFWVTIDADGAAGVPCSDSASRTYLVSTERATVVAGLKRRPPDPHPGETVRPVMIAIQLIRNDSGLFVPVDHSH